MTKKECKDFRKQPTMMIKKRMMKSRRYIYVNVVGMMMMLCDAMRCYANRTGRVDEGEDHVW